MEFGLSEEQRMLQESVAGYLSSSCPLERVREAAEAGVTHDSELAVGLAQLGVQGILVPEDLGGVGMGYLEAALVSEALGSVAAPVGFVASAVMAPVALMAAGSDDQREQWLPAIASGETNVGVAVTERIGIREGSGISCRDGRLQGKAMFVLEGPDADVLLVADESGVLYLVQTANLDITKLKTIDRTRGVAEVNFDGADADLLPGSAGNTDALQRVIDAGRVMIGADTLGAAQKMLDDAVAYAKERTQFNRVIGSFQAVKHMCAEMAAELEPCRSMVWYAAHAMTAVPEDARLMACHTKAHLAETAKFVARTATEVHGGMGMTDLLGLHYWFKRIGFNRQIFGTPEIVREEAARIQNWVRGTAADG